MSEQPAAAPPAAAPAEAAPAPKPAAPPAAAAASQAAAAPEDGLTDAEREQLSALLAKRSAAAAGAGAVRMKVEPPHSELSHGGVTITNEFSHVQPGLAAAMTEAAADAGVTITQET